jgi:hypothetical protein
MACGIATAAVGSSSAGARGCVDHSHNLVLAKQGKCPAHTSAVTLGARGPKGARGLRGAQGMQGKQGIQGKSGVGAVASVVESTGSDVSSGTVVALGTTVSVTALCMPSAALKFDSSDPTVQYYVDLGLNGSGVTAESSSGGSQGLTPGGAFSEASTPPPAGTVGGEDDLSFVLGATGRSILNGLAVVGDADYAFTAYLDENTSGPACTSRVVVTPTS